MYKVLRPRLYRISLLLRHNTEVPHCSMNKILVFLFCLVHGITGDFQSDSQANQLNVEFQYAKSEGWNSAVVEKFRQVLATYSSEYCGQNTSDCNMGTFDNFTESDVKILPKYPKTVKSTDSVLLFYVMLPKNTSLDTNSYFVLPKQTVVDIVGQNRAQLTSELQSSSELRHAFAFRVSYINNVLALDPDDDTLNIIITPIAFGVVLLMILIVISLEFSRSKQRKREVKLIQEEKLRQREISEHSVPKNGSPFQSGSSSVLQQTV
ncbi:unnamed protein product [Clavelina lepadiformis]|uniref:DUF8077 domain-containing protein n=1 Tax=Clavelina lepadiformis TaxID=159417 RepID=A0ABP0GQL0_CLALP